MDVAELAVARSIDKGICARRRMPVLRLMNLSIALNASRGPGIVVATVRMKQGHQCRLQTALPILAVVTSQVVGAWLDYMVRRGRPLLSNSREAGEAEHTVVSYPAWDQWAGVDSPAATGRSQLAGRLTAIPA